MPIIMAGALEVREVMANEFCGNMPKPASMARPACFREKAAAETALQNRFGKK